jgi:hypothetical protein
MSGYGATHRLILWPDRSCRRPKTSSTSTALVPSSRLVSTRRTVGREALENVGRPLRVADQNQPLRSELARRVSAVVSVAGSPLADDAPASMLALLKTISAMSPRQPTLPEAPRRKSVLVSRPVQRASSIARETGAHYGCATSSIASLESVASYKAVSEKLRDASV